MTAPRELLIQLLDYIKEQAKEINPQGYRLASVRGFLRVRDDIAGLLGAEFDLRVEGDHIWLRVPRLAAEPPPKPPETQKEFLRISSDPDGPEPTFDEPAFLNYLNRAVKETDPDGRGSLEASIRNAAARALESYTVSWKSWAEGERPRRKTIALYGDLFALMHQMEAEE